MPVQASQSISRRFCLANPSTGAASNADSTPTGTLLANGSAMAASVVISAGGSTGEYNASFTIPSGQAVGDQMDLEVAATVGGVTGRAVVWRDVVDATVNSRLAPTTAGRTLDVDTSHKAPATLASTDVTGNLPADLKAMSGGDGGKVDALRAAIGANVVAASGNWLTTLGANAPAGWINAAAVAAAALNGKGDWSTHTAADVRSEMDANSTQLAALTARLTAARAGYLDNLNVGGAVASHADILALNQSASRRIVLSTVGQYERPESGTTGYTIEARTYDKDGAAVNADSTPTLSVTGSVSGSLAANLSAASNPATGVYRWTYSTTAAATQEQVRGDVSAVIGGSTFTLSVYTQVVDLVAATWTTTDRQLLTDIHDKLPAGAIGDATEANATTNKDAVLARLGTPAGASVSADVAAVKSDAAATLIQATAAAASAATAAAQATQASLDAGTAADAAIDAKAVTDKLDTLIEDDPDNAGDYRLTEAAVANVQIETGDITADVDPQTVRNALALALDDDVTIQDGSIDSKLSAAKVVILSPLDPDTSDLELVRGDSYSATHGRAISFPIGAAPDLTGAVLKWRAKRLDLAGSFTAEVVCTVTGAGTSNQVVVFAPTADFTRGLVAGPANYVWDLQATWAGEDPATLQRGLLSVIDDVVGNA
jgi:hypothetical protein